MWSMRPARWFTRSVVVLALAATLAGCAASEPEVVDENAGAVPGTPAASQDIIAALANARIAVLTYMVGSPGKVVPQVADLADYGYDNTLTTAAITVYSQELSLEAAYCLEAKTGAGFVYKAVGDDGPVIPGTCTLDTDY